MTNSQLATYLKGMRWSGVLAVIAIALTPSRAGATGGGVLQYLRTVARSDQRLIPGGNNLIDSIQSHALNNDGKAAFLSFSDNRWWLWAERGGQLAQLSAGELVVDQIFFNDAGEVLFNGFPRGQVVSQRMDRLYKWGASGVTLLAGPPLPVLNENGNPLGNLVQTRAILAAVHPDGPLVFQGQGSQAGSSSVAINGFWSGNGREPGYRLVVASGAPVPGGPAGTRFTESNAYSQPHINAIGQFVMTIDTIGPGNLERDSLISNRDGQVKVLYKQGDPIPGQGSGVTFGGLDNRFFAEPVINNRGDIAFVAGVDQTGLPSFGAMFADREGRLDLVAVQGQPVLGGLGNLTIKQFNIGDMALNESGRLAFRCILNNPANADRGDAIVVEETDSVLRIVASDGDAVPGAPAGATFELDRQNGFQFNRLGQIAFPGRYYCPQDGSLKFGVFVDDPRRGLTPIALPGDLIEVALGDVRQIDSAGLAAGPTGGEDGVKMILNDRGQILFHAIFLDGTSGIFVSNVVAVPEHKGLALAVAAFAAALRWRRVG